MKRTIFFAAFLAALFLAGCGTVADKLTPRFYDVTQQDDSTRLYPGSIELAGVPVLVVSLANDVPGWDVQMEAPRIARLSDIRDKVALEAIYWDMYMQGGFFDRIVSLRTAESLRRMTAATLVECDSTSIGTAELGRMNRAARARLAVVLRGVNFHYDRSSGGRYSGNTWQQLVHYRSVWDLCWMDGERVESRRTVVQNSSYWITTGRGEPLEGVLACALKVSDDFVSLFRQTQTRPRRK